MSRYDSPLSCECGCGPVGGISRESGSSSPARCRRLARACALSMISLCLLFVAHTAHAATWPVPTSGLSATLAFHQSYTAGDNSYVHSGIDIPASAGMQISAPLAGTVRFTGTVPSGDSKTGGTSSQRTMQAVSVEVAGGRVVTLMPFATTQVQVGQQVAEGAPLGTLAASGDVSTPGTHLHMGYRQGTTYLDPMLLFGVTSSHPEQDAQREVEGSPAPDPETAFSMSLSTAGGAAESSLSRHPERSGSESREVEGSPAPDLEPIPESFGVIETGAFERDARMADAPSPLDPVTAAFESLASACYGQFTALAQALVALSQGTGIPLPALYVTLFAMGLGGLMLLGIAFVRLFGARLRDAWAFWVASSSNGPATRKSPLVPARGR